MNQILLTEPEAALRELGVACQSASRYYETAAGVAHGAWRDHAARRSIACRDMSRRIGDVLKREDILPGSPDADMEWLKEIALRAQTALSGDERGALLKGFAQTERRIWDALGNLGSAGGITPHTHAIASELSTDLTASFRWLGIEKEALLKHENK
jgi:hypothetical protein